MLSTTAGGDVDAEGDEVPWNILRMSLLSSLDAVGASGGAALEADDPCPEVEVEGATI